MQAATMYHCGINSISINRTWEGFTVHVVFDDKVTQATIDLICELLDVSLDHLYVRCNQQCAMFNRREA